MINLYFHIKTVSQKMKVMFFVILLSNVTYSQIKLTDLHYNNDTLSMNYELNQSFHSSIKPYVVPVIFTSNNSMLQTGINFRSRSDKYDWCGDSYRIHSQLKIYPLLNLSSGYDNLNNLTLTSGVGLAMDYYANKLLISTKFLPFYTKANAVNDSIINFGKIYPGAGPSILPNIFFNGEAIAALKVNKFFTFIGGYGKNFLGDGYRSLLLSDNAASNPFFKIETSFSSIKYVNLYQVWRDIHQPVNSQKANTLKYSASHYLSWNITKSFNLGIFETVVIGGEDSLSDRGFDLNYLNPVVFYRPVEYGMGSADNVLLGVNLNYKIKNSQKLYYQLILDEFLLSEIKAKSKWWANKFGMQIGYKARDVFVKNLNIQSEFNMVRPFTYSHKHSAQNYGHLNASVAHPIGANFFEWINMVSYKKEKNQFSAKLIYSAYGIDSSAVNYGQNIFNSYADRDGNYDHLIMQGLKTNVFNANLKFEHEIIPKINLYFNISYNYRYEINIHQQKHNHFINVGLKSRIWNTYSDF